MIPNHIHPPLQCDRRKHDCPLQSIYIVRHLEILAFTFKSNKILCFILLLFFACAISPDSFYFSQKLQVYLRFVLQCWLYCSDHTSIMSKYRRQFYTKFENSSVNPHTFQQQVKINVRLIMLHRPFDSIRIFTIEFGSVFVYSLHHNIRLSIRHQDGWCCFW